MGSGRLSNEEKCNQHLDNARALMKRAKEVVSRKGANLVMSTGFLMEAQAEMKSVIKIITDEHTSQNGRNTKGDGGSVLLRPSVLYQTKQQGAQEKGDSEAVDSL